MNLSAQVLEFVAQPSERSVPKAIRAVGDVLLKKYGRSALGILLYGSCLRAGTDQGSLVDCYVLVDHYASVYQNAWLARLNQWLPPNVFYCEVLVENRVVRVKYAVLSLDDFERSVSPQSFHSYFWARFAQPTVLLTFASQAVRQRIVCGLGMAVLTFLRTSLSRVAGQFTAGEIWMTGLSLSYGAELRAEPTGRAEILWNSDCAYYEQLTHAVFSCHFPDVQVVPQQDGYTYVFAETGCERLRNRLGWLLRRWQGKMLSVLRLIKGAFTFQGGIDYVLWKIRRHAGITVHLTPAQRRYPILAGLKALWRLYRQGAFR
jgi:hypothetical protein